MTFSRRTRIILPSVSNGPKDTVIAEKREARERSGKRSHDRRSRQLAELDVGQYVVFQHTEGQNWNLGEITEIVGPNAYQIKGANRGTYRRNGVHMRPTRITQRVRDFCIAFS